MTVGHQLPQVVRQPVRHLRRLGTVGDLPTADTESAARSGGRPEVILRDIDNDNNVVTARRVQLCRERGSHRHTSRHQTKFPRLIINIHPIVRLDCAKITLSMVALVPHTSRAHVGGGEARAPPTREATEYKKT